MGSVPFHQYSRFKLKFKLHMCVLLSPREINGVKRDEMGQVCPRRSNLRGRGRSKMCEASNGWLLVECQECSHLKADRCINYRARWASATDVTNWDAAELSGTVVAMTTGETKHFGGTVSRYFYSSTLPKMIWGTFIFSHLTTFHHFTFSGNARRLTHFRKGKTIREEK